MIVTITELTYVPIIESKKDELIKFLEEKYGIRQTKIILEKLPPSELKKRRTNNDKRRSNRTVKIRNRVN